MGQTRAQKLEAVGLEGMSEEHKLVLQPMVRAMARMIAEATKPKEKRAKDPEASADYRAGKAAHTFLSHGYGKDAVAWEPVQARTLITLGKAVRETLAGDKEFTALGWWLEEGGLDWMSDPPTTSYIARNFADLVAKAEAWADKRVGKQPTSALDRVRR